MFIKEAGNGTVMASERMEDILGLSDVASEIGSPTWPVWYA